MQRLKLWDGGIIRIAPNSTIRITNDFCDKRSLDLKDNIKSMAQSKEPVFGGGGYEVTTNGAVGGVRGTEFEVITEKDKMIFKVYEGKIEILILNDETNKLVIKAYEKLIEDMQSRNHQGRVYRKNH